MRRRKIYTILIVVFILSFIILETSTFADAGKHHVLFLHSYDSQNSWTRDISEGFFETINNYRGSILVSEEYMDTKRNRSTPYFENFTRYFEEKYKGVKFSLIVTSDNNAFNYVREENQSFFGDTPVVFVGLNPTKDNINLSDRYSGVYEQVDVESTLNVISDIHPDDSKILIVSDETVTGQAVLENVRHAVENFQGKQALEFFMSSSLEAIDSKLDRLNRYDAVLMILYNVDDQGVHYTYNEGLDEVYKRSPAPIYGMWKFYLGEGIVGGYLTDGYEHGKATAEQVVAKLQGGSITSTGLIEIEPKLVFDYIEMKKFGLEKIVLPSDAEIVNQPREGLREFAPFIIGVAITVGLIAMILALWYLNRKEHMMNDLLESEKERLTSLIDKDLNMLVEERTSELSLINKQCEVLNEDHKRLKIENDGLKNQLHACKQNMNQLAFQSEGIRERMVQLDMSLRMYNIYLKGHMKTSIHVKEAMSELQISRERLSSMMSLYKLDKLKRSDLEAYIKNSQLDSDKLYERLEVLYKESHQLLDGEVFNIMSLSKNKSTNEILVNACKLAMVENSNRLIEIETEIASELPNVPSASYLTYIVLQLISNCLYHAFDSIGIGKIKVHARAATNKFILEVWDNGTGMTAHELSNAFEPFYTTKSGLGMLGIGLGNIKQIVEDVFDGQVDLSSSENEGTRIYIEIPTAEATYE